MRSKSSGVESPANGVLGVPQATQDINQEEDVNLHTPIKSLKVKVQPNIEELVEEVVVVSDIEKSTEDSLGSSDKRLGIMNLTEKDLLRLLGVMEGEVQAREDVICVLKTKRTRPEALKSHYGSAAPTTALQALQRDSLLTNTQTHIDNVYQRPMAELDRLQEKHKDTYRRMLEQLLLTEKCHRRTVHELDSEKRKHADYMNKSDEFTNLLELERERLKRLLENEKAYQVRKEKENTKRLEKVREELVKLKSFALMLVDERQLHLEQMDQQSQRVQELTQQLSQREQDLRNASAQAQEDRQRALSLESELSECQAKFTQEQEEITAKLASQESQNRQLDVKLSGLTHTLEELEESNRALRRSEEEYNGALRRSEDKLEESNGALRRSKEELEESNRALRTSKEELEELRDKISKGDCGNSNLMTELENLRKRVFEMEGQDEEITKAEAQCRELRKRLQEEESRGKELKLQVEKLQRRMVELERLEVAFNASKAECFQLHTTLEREKDMSKELADELVAVKICMKEMESSELRLEKTEQGLKDDLAKLKSFTMVMIDEKNNMMERMMLEEKKRDDLSKMFKVEQVKVMEGTERLIEESKKLLKLKSEMEAKVGTLVREKGELSTKLTCEMEKSKDLSSKVSQLNKRLDGLQEAEHISTNNIAKRELGSFSDGSSKEDNRVKELTFEIERLKNRLTQLEVVEGDLIKTEDQYDLLEKKFMTEQDKANILSQQVEEMRSQIARIKAIENGEVESQEADLRQRCRTENANTRDLQNDMVALKEKIHELMHKEDQLSQLQVDYSFLQQRFLEEEEKKNNMSIEVLHLTKELEVTKRHSRALRPSLNGRRMVDIAMASTGVQTDALANEMAEEDTPAVFIRKSVQEENHIMSNLRQKGLKKPTEKAGGHERYSPSVAADLSMKKSWIPWMRKREIIPQGGNLDKSVHINSESMHSDLAMSQKQGQPLRIRVTPDHENSTATLEISSPSAEDLYSSSSLSLSPTLQGHQKPRITIIPTHTTAASRGKASAGTGGAERSKSPVTVTTISRAKSPEISKASSSSSSSGRPISPISIMTVSASMVSNMSTSPEPQEMTMGRAVFKVTPEKQMVPTPIRKYNSNASIITTTEDNKIHIHLHGSQFNKGPSEGHNNNTGPKVVVRPVGMATECSREMMLSTGTVLRSPRHSATAVKTTPSKVMSSITITAVTSTPARPTQAVPGHDTHPSRAGLTRIPMSKGLKTGKAMLGALGMSGGMRLEQRAESQSMRIELKKSTISSTTAFQNGGKSC
ncbi:filamin-A-interacting protein 1-like isoform X1 [Salvelinus namaycush]|uniref:Filamin-A-interacting protein 1-like isoform X1 n=2 Tax=Salvelinus namaycush TaxID=8040 RepID=A0A8U1EWE0_SALNM|nr:filamin-A-interacting protein 1-like isoform X1 [Salvelinus namaycush]